MQESLIELPQPIGGRASIRGKPPDQQWSARFGNGQGGVEWTPVRRGLYWGYESRSSWSLLFGLNEQTALDMEVKGEGFVVNRRPLILSSTVWFLPIDGRWTQCTIAVDGEPHLVVYPHRASRRIR